MSVRIISIPIDICSDKYQDLANYEYGIVNKGVYVALPFWANIIVYK